VLLETLRRFIKNPFLYIPRENVQKPMTDGRQIAERMMNTTGAPRIMMALLRSGPSYVKSLSYDTRLVDKTVRKALKLLIEFKLVKVHLSPDQKVPHAKDYYILTSNGKEMALMLVECNNRMIDLFDKMMRQPQKGPSH
jgi:hypothetical protein